jgi:hypothetical protein
MDDDPVVGIDDLAWEVRVRVYDRQTRASLLAKASSEGWFVVTKGARRVAFGVRSEVKARDLAGRVRVLVPLGSEIEIRRLSRLRGWLVKERLYGSVPRRHDRGGREEGPPRGPAFLPQRRSRSS